MNKKLEGKVAIITGGGMGIGLGIAETYLNYGAHVIIIDKSDKIAETLGSLRQKYDRVTAYKLDIRDREMVKRVVATIYNKFKTVDILVNNAGVAIYKPFLEMKDEDRDIQIDINIKGTWNLIQEVLPIMLKNKKGSVVSLSSVTGPLVADEGASAYALSKSAILGLTKALAVEYAPSHIRFNAIQPGVINTPLLRSNAGDNQEEGLKLMGETVPLGRLGDPKEVGELAAFLGSDESSYITGEGIVIDGASTLPETNNVLGRN